MHTTEIIGCQHCQVNEDNEIVQGAETPITISEVYTDEYISFRCPNCRALLSETDFILIGLIYPIRFAQLRAA